MGVFKKNSSINPSDASIFRNFFISREVKSRRNKENSCQKWLVKGIEMLFFNYPRVLKVSFQGFSLEGLGNYVRTT